MPTASRTETGVNGPLDAPSSAPGEDRVDVIDKSRTSFRAPPTWNAEPRKSAASSSTAWAAAPAPGSAPGGKTGSSPRRSTTRWSACSSSGSSTRCRPCTPTQAVRRHLAEYLAEAGDRVPWWLSLAIRARPRRLGPGSLACRVPPVSSAGVMARKFIAGATPAEAIQTVVGSPSAQAGVHGRPAGRGRDQRARSRPVPANLPDPPARPGRPDLAASPRSHSSTATSTARFRASISRSSSRA